MNRKNLTYILGGVLVVAIGAAAYLGYFSGDKPSNLNLLASGVNVELKPTDNVHGSPDAPITVVEYASMTCPHCAAFHKEVVPQLTKDYIDTGKVKMVFREFPLDGGATMAAALARCMKGDNYFAFIDLLFRSQEKWWLSLFQGGGQQQITREKVENNLVEIARVAGMSRDKAVTCMSDKANLDLVQANWQEGQTRYQVNSTPTIIVDGETYRGDMTYAAVKKIVDERLAKR